MRSRRVSTVGWIVAVAALLALAPGSRVSASHAWGPYHWARTVNEFGLTVVNSTTSDWDGYVANALADWSKGWSPHQDVVNLIGDPDGSVEAKDRRQCRAPSGAVRICNLAYGFNGWLGIAGIYIDSAGHIYAGYTKLNDSYFGLSSYNTPQWKQSVTCQELGHNLGLDHQDENFNNQTLESCMDYQDPPFPLANEHDFEQLAAIYGHLDGYDSYAASTSGPEGGEGGGCNAPEGKGCNKGVANPGEDARSWGLSLGRRGQHETFIRIEPDGTRLVTFVTWAERQ